MTNPAITTGRWLTIVTLLVFLTSCDSTAGVQIWVEGENPSRTTATTHAWYGGQVDHQALSGGDFLCHYSDRGPAESSYNVQVPKAGDYDFWVRANPVQAKLSYRIGRGDWTPIDLEKDVRGRVNIARDGKADLRFLAWERVGRVPLTAGENVVTFLMSSTNHNHGALDCFVFSDEPFEPNGFARPDTNPGAAAVAPRGEWFAFNPPSDPYRPSSAIDLRVLNEKAAGDGGFIGVKDGRFVHSATGDPVRFWAVNGPSEAAKTPADLAREARVLAKRGVNFVRQLHAVYDPKGTPRPEEIRHAQEVVEAMKREGIYSHFSIYFPLFLKPDPRTPWLPGYDGKARPFAALMFNPRFQEHYRSWWKALLLSPHPATGKRLVDDPAVFGLEIQNEDSFFFWTFALKNVPDVEMRLIEAKFASWVKARHGSIPKALASWGRGSGLDRDDPAGGRMALRPLWNIVHQKTARDRDTVAFLAETQRVFYRDTAKFLRDLGFRGVISASNWTTASPEVLGPVEKYTYTPGDFLDRHGYFSGTHSGESSNFSIRDGHTYNDRSALRFDPAQPGKPRLFNHPVMDPKYAGKPSMISETTFNRPNRYRSEAPLFYAVYGALQGSDAIVHFALDTTRWAVKPRTFVQPWTLMTPSMMGQFPASALIYRKGLVAEGDVLVDLNLRPSDILALKGTPLPQDASLDELRLADVPEGGAASLAPGQVIDPLVHLAGRVSVRFEDRGAASVIKDLSPFIDRDRKVVRGSNGQLDLDYGVGVLKINAPAAQGVSGDLKAAGTVDLADLSVTSGSDLEHVVAVSLDDRPLASSGRILLQVMTEEQPTGFRAIAGPGGVKTIASLGRDPWLVREIEGVVRFKRPDAASLRVTALDGNGDPHHVLTAGPEIRLQKDVLYYLIEAPTRAAR